ncbi:MAG TPA: hypothetical protein VLS25_10555 [Dehalococcoidia bacterium]|nr:hypothetical protein [Dehalococcoidia bacterium]
MKEFTRIQGPEPFPDRPSNALSGLAGRLDRVHALAGVLALGLTAYLAIEPTQNWLLLLLCALAALGTDGVVRTHPHARFHSIDDTALFLFVPVLFTFALGIFLEEVAGGHLTILLGLASAVPYWLIIRAEYESVDRASEDFHYHRLILNIATYVIAFLFFATIFDFDLSLTSSAFAAGIVSLLLAIEVLREEAMDTPRTVIYAIAVGVLLAETAWTTHFLPFESSPAAVFLLLAFYLMTGLMHSYLANRLNPRTAGEFAVVAMAGLLIVTVSHTYI